MLRNVAGALAGLIVSAVIYTLIREIGDMIFSPPSGLDFSDPGSLRTYRSQLPLEALLFVFAKPVVAVFFGTLVACYVGTANAWLFGATIGGIVLTYSISFFIVEPHPLWLSLATLIGIVLSTLLAIRVAPYSEEGPPELFDSDGDTG